MGGMFMVSSASSAATNASMAAMWLIIDLL